MFSDFVWPGAVFAVGVPVAWWVTCPRRAIRRSARRVEHLALAIRALLPLLESAPTPQTPARVGDLDPDLGPDLGLARAGHHPAA